MNTLIMKLYFLASPVKAAFLAGSAGAGPTLLLPSPVLPARLECVLEAALRAG